MKRKLLLLLALMAIGLSGAWAYNYDFSADAPSGQTLYYDIVDGNARVTSQNSSSPYYSTYPRGSLEIPASVTYNGTTYSVTSIGEYAFCNCISLASVTIPNSVTSIGALAFGGCISLASVTIPNSVTSIGSSAFGGCSSLTSVTIPNSVTSIGNYAFSGCSGLTSVTIPNSVTSIEGAFSGCSGLTSVTIPNSVTNIGYKAFYGCCGLTSVTIPSSVTSIGESAFRYCSGLTSVTIPNSVTSIGNYAFSDCSGLTSVSIGNSVTSIGNYAFSDCSGLTSVTIGNSVISIGQYAFYGCSGLTGVTIPNSVTSIGNKAFYNCSRLTSVTIGNSVISIGEDAFRDCSGLTSVTMRGTVPPTVDRSVFYGNASNRKIYVPCGAYETYCNATNGWSNYRNCLSDPIVDIYVTVNAGSGGNASIIPLRGQNVRCDSTIVVTATPNYGYHFTHWSTGSTQAQDTITIEGDTTITAYFAANQTNGIDEVDQLPTISVSGNSITVVDAQNKMLSIFDITGRMIVHEQAVEGKAYTMPNTGVYMVQVGNHPAEKVVVIR